ncbi:LysM peptidoglycan-binding domain-containing protein, partial [Acinetobacter baumannii]
TKYTDNNENSTTVYQTTTTTYSKDNQIIEQKKEGGNGAGTTQYTYLADKVTLDKTVMTPTSGSIQTTQYAYEWWDSAKQSKITTTVDGLKGETSLSYNINGHLTDFVDDRNTNNRRVATYINNSQGMVLQRNELINDSINRYRNFYYVNGQRVGDLSNDGPSREDYVQNLQNNRATATQAKDFKPISSADFDQNFEPINAQYPSSASTSYVVNNGDTLQSIALSVWGDASMWYMLADVNGLSATDKLTAGQVLTVPNKVTNIHNNSETFRPYNPGEAIGNTQPTVPSPPPPPKPKKKCGGIAQIVMIVVAVVATIFTAGAALSVIAPGMSLFAGGLSVLAGTSSLGIAGSMAVAAGAAAVGSAASQLVGKAMGVVDSFSWSQVGISALTAAATAGVGGALAPAAGAAGTTGATVTQSSWASAAKTAINNGGWVAKGAVYGAVSYGSTYLANQVFGNNQSFSWASLGSSIVGSIAAAGIGAKGVFERLGTTASPYAYSLAGANAAAVIDDKWFGGSKPDYLNVSMAAIANTVGRQFGENAEEWFNYPTTKTLSIYDENAFSFLSTDYNSQQPMYGDASRYNGSLPDTVGLETIAISASDRKDLYLDIAKEAPKDNSLNITNALDGAKSFFQNRAQALEEWGSASVPFQYSWATPKINTGNPRLDRYYFQPVNDVFNTTANVGWNALKLVGNTAAIVSNSPVALFSAVSGDYEASQQFYEDLYLSNPLTASIGGLRSGLGYIRDVREFNKATVVGRTIGANQRGSASLGLLNDIPAGSTTGEVLTASMPVTKSPGAILRDKWGYLSSAERQNLIVSKGEAVAERWVNKFEDNLNQTYFANKPKFMQAHFVEKHGPDIPLRPNLEARAIDGRHPRTGIPSKTGRPQTSSQFYSWRTQMDVINEAITRDIRGLPRYNAGLDKQGDLIPAVVGYKASGVGHGFTPTRRGQEAPSYNSQMNGWKVVFDDDHHVPYTAYPTK